MREFFKGWRRMTGCVTLVMACAVTSAWLRSVTYQDTFCISSTEDSQTLLVSVAQQLIVAKVSNVSAQKPRLWKSENIESSVGWLFSSGKNWEVFLEYPERRFGFATYTTVQASRTVSVTTLHSLYWSVVIPLTLLSAYLIVWKPRSKPKNAVAELPKVGA